MVAGHSIGHPLLGRRRDRSVLRTADLHPWEAAEGVVARPYRRGESRERFRAEQRGRERHVGVVTAGVERLAERVAFDRCGAGSFVGDHILGDDRFLVDLGVVEQRLAVVFDVVVRRDRLGGREAGAVGRESSVGLPR